MRGFLGRSLFWGVSVGKELGTAGWDLDVNGQYWGRL